jgi:hypothetical protein
MSPNYNDGDWLLFRLLPAKVKPGSRVKPGSKINALVGKVVLVQRQSQGGTDFLQVKRVTKVTKVTKVTSNPTKNSKSGNDFEVWVEGDNKSASTDSRSWGAIDSNEVIGKLVFRYRRGAKK